MTWKSVLFYHCFVIIMQWELHPLGDMYMYTYVTEAVNEHFHLFVKLKKDLIQLHFNISDILIYAFHKQKLWS